MDKTVPFTEENIRAMVAGGYPTPFYVYDRQGILDTARLMNESLGRLHGYKNFFAVKALPNPAIVSLLAKQGFGADCSSEAELRIASMAGLSGERIMFTSNNTSAHEFRAAHALGAIINFDDIMHVDFYQKHIGELPEVGCFRFNPGEAKRGNEIIGDPVQAKYDITFRQAISAYGALKEAGVERFGIHTMVVSGESDYQKVLETVGLLFDLVGVLHKGLGIAFEFINIGGGLGIPYHPTDEALDVELLSEGIAKLYQEKILSSGHPECAIVTECGRYVTGPHGYLVSTVQHVTEKHKMFVGLDACMANLARPALYGAYHHITVLGKQGEKYVQRYDVTGSLCENNDKFAIDRLLPGVDSGDVVIIHDAGAHGHAMGGNYNGRLRSAEFLWDRSTLEAKMIRRAETLGDHFATLV